MEQLLKLRREFFGDETPELVIPDDENQVEWIVRDIVDQHQTKDAMASQEIDEKDEGSKQQQRSVPTSGRTVITVEEDERTLCGLLQAKRLAQEAAFTKRGNLTATAKIRWATQYSLWYSPYKKHLKMNGKKRGHEKRDLRKKWRK